MLRILKDILTKNNLKISMVIMYSYMTDNSNSGFSGEDMVLNKNKDGVIQSGGYKINSILMSRDMMPMKTMNDKKSKANTKSELVSQLLSDFAVPAGLLYLTSNASSTTSNYQTDTRDEVIDDSLYDKLMKLAEETSKSKTGGKKLTKRKARNNKSKTKRRNHKL
jgi:hypothetical protein